MLADGQPCVKIKSSIECKNFGLHCPWCGGHHSHCDVGERIARDIATRLEWLLDAQAKNIQEGIQSCLRSHVQDAAGLEHLNQRSSLACLQRPHKEPPLLLVPVDAGAVPSDFPPSLTVACEDVELEEVDAKSPRSPKVPDERQAISYQRSWENRAPAGPSTTPQGRHDMRAFRTGSEQRARDTAANLRQNRRMRATFSTSLPKQADIGRYSVVTSGSVATALSDWRWLCKKIVSSVYFDAFVGLAILVNSVVLGMEVDYVAKELPDTTPLAYRASHYLFLGIFAVELALRVTACGAQFLCGPGKWWNLFDVVIFVAGIAEVVLEMFTDSAREGLRAARAVRVVRIVRMWKLRAFQGLRTMIRMIIGTFKSLAWSLVLMFAVTYIFAMGFTQGCAYYLLDKKGETLNDDEELLKKHFGTIPKSAYFLCASLMNGESWGSTVLRTLPMMGSGYVVLFLMFMAFSFFALLNVITSFFCENAFVKVKDDRDRIVAEQMRNVDKYIEEFKDIFLSLDAENVGEVTLQDLERNLENKEVQAYLRHLHLNVEKAWDIFRLIDVDRSGTISMEEFVHGCLRLRGEAQAMDVARIGYELNKTQDLIGDFIEVAEQNFARMGSAPVEVQVAQLSNSLSPAPEPSREHLVIQERPPALYPDLPRSL